MSSTGKDSATLEQEVEQQRQRIEDRIGEIRERLSPGQLVDELMSYTKDGGKHFAANLGETVSNNPLPAALLGVSLVWLMTGQGNKHNHASHGHGQRHDYSQYDDDLPYASSTGGIRRVSHASDDAGNWYSHFEDNAGKRYKAPSNEHGHRIGHFVDDAGKKFGGFIDEAGHRVKDFRDEAGNKLDDAFGWASHAWQKVQQKVGDSLSGIGGHAQHMGSDFGRQAQQFGNEAQQQMDRLNRTIMNTFESQPLVAGALAFAAGAALGAALPHTRQEDQLLGEAADTVKSKAAEIASDVYEEGKEVAGSLYEKGKESVSEVYDDLRQAAKPQGNSTTTTAFN